MLKTPLVTLGLFAINGDLAQFYNCYKLLAEQWNLQRFVWHDDLNPENPLLEGVITTLIYGVRSISKQSEDAVEQLADTRTSLSWLSSSFSAGM